MRVNPNPEVMRWAMTRSGESEDTLSAAFPKLSDWLAGTLQPTLNQMEDFARRTHLSLDAFFLDGVPELGLQIADFRTLDGTRGDPSPELYDTINQMMFRQDWMRSYFLEEGYEPIGVVGMLGESPDDFDAALAAGAIRDWLGLPQDWAFALPGSAEALRAFRDAIESMRVSVVINGIVNDNTHRPLSVEEFRGFVLSDEWAPLIFVNGADAKAAQVFTLAHELAHLAFARTGVVSPGIEDVRADVGAERACDAIAAELLMPSALFGSVWSGRDDDYERACRASKLFKTSVPACARRAVGLGLIGWPAYRSLLDRHSGQLEKSSARAGGGGNYYRTKGYRLGNVFGEAVLTAVKSRAITYVEAFQLTGLGPKTFDAYFEGAA